MSDFSDTFDDAKTEAKRKARDGYRTAREGYRTAREGVREARRTVGARTRDLRESYSGVQENLVHASDDLSDFVRQNPGRSVLFAAGFGFLLGLILRGFRD